MDIYSEKKAMKDLNSLYAEAVYGKPKTAGQELEKREKDDDAFVANIFCEIPLKEYMFEGMLWLAGAGLGFSTVEKFM